jgi:hypothetical protein
MTRQRAFEPNDPISEERVARALLHVAELVKAHPKLAPLVNRLERELLDRRFKDPVARARSLVGERPHI